MADTLTPRAPAITFTALKEWAVAVKALEEGREVLILRKGGIHEKRFPIEHDQFFLYPTYDHQREDLLKPDFHADLREVLLLKCPPGKVTISAFARATHVWELSRDDLLAELSERVMWVHAYAAERLRWRPTQPLRVVALRVYRLPEPRVLDVLPEYGGCLSWIQLTEHLEQRDLQPTLSDEAYAARIAPVLELLGPGAAPATA